MTRNWLDIDSYLDTDALEQSKGHIGDAQERDAERRTRGICSVELKTGWSGAAPEITMVVNRGLQSEMTLMLSREQTAARARRTERLLSRTRLRRSAQYDVVPDQSDGAEQSDPAN